METGWPLGTEPLVLKDLPGGAGGEVMGEASAVPAASRAAAVLLWIVAAGWGLPAPWLMWWMLVRGRLPAVDTGESLLEDDELEGGSGWAARNLVDQVFSPTGGGTPSPGIPMRRSMRLWMVRGFSGRVRLCPDVLRELLEGTQEAIARPTDDVPVVKPGCDVEA